MPKYLAVYLGTPPKPGDQRPAMDPGAMQRGMVAWQQWMIQHMAIITDVGGPLGKTKVASQAGISDTSNAMTGYVILTADGHDEAVKLFENHPHFSIFPGDSVEVMEVMPMPGG